MTKKNKWITGVLTALAAGALLAGCGDGASGGGKPVRDGFVWVVGGTFTMGSPDSETERPPYERQHKVTVSSFYISQYEVTQGLYKKIMGYDPSVHKGDNYPVEAVDWYDTLEFCNKLSVEDKLEPVYVIANRVPADAGQYPITSADVSMDMSKNGYRLPTEAEWEYAARGGRNWNSPYFVYAGSNNVSEVAWDETSETHEVGGKKPNALALYDMSGNVSEWCWDYYGDYPTTPQTDPTGPESESSNHVQRGGNYKSIHDDVRSAARGHDQASDWQKDHTGFRVVRRH